MRAIYWVQSAILASILSVFIPANAGHAAADWSQFRGHAGDGSSDSRGLPVHWSETENLRWKTALPGKGWSSPVIADGRVWMTSSLSSGHSLRALCVDTATGKLLHNVEVFRVTTAESIDNDANTHASPTPVLDRDRVFVSYGTHGNACLDAQSGKVLWRNQQLRFFDDHNGPGSSPIIYSNRMIVHCDGAHQPYIAALKTDTGDTAWITKRSRPSGKAFSTPLLTHVDGRPWLLSVASRRVGAYEPATGKEFWSVDLPGNTIVPRPVVHRDVVFVCTGFPKSELWAIRLTGAGVVSEADAVIWKYKKQVPQVSSPVIVGERIYFVSDTGILTCLDAATGDEFYSGRIEGSFFASPVVAEERIYFPNNAGKTFVIKASSRFEVWATNSLMQGCYASPATVGSGIYLRTIGHLYRIEK